MFAVRGFEFTHETVRAWQEQFGSLLSQNLKAKRQGKATKNWRVDETLAKIKGVYHFSAA